MAITDSQFRTDMEAVKTLLTADDYAGALKQLAIAETTLAGLPEESDTTGAKIKMRAELDSVRAAIKAARDANYDDDNRYSDNRRFIRTGFSFGGGGR